MTTKLETIMTITMKFCEINDDELFEKTLTFDFNSALTETLKLSFKFIKPSFILNSETSYVLNFKTDSKALFKPVTLSR